MKQEKEKIAHETSRYDQQIGEKVMEIVNSLQEKNAIREKEMQDKIQHLEAQLDEYQRKYEELSDNYAVLKVNFKSKS